MLPDNEQADIHKNFNKWKTIRCFSILLVAELGPCLHFYRKKCSFVSFLELFFCCPLPSSKCHYLQILQSINGKSHVQSVGLLIFLIHTRSELLYDRDFEPDTTRSRNKIRKNALCTAFITQHFVGYRYATIICQNCSRIPKRVRSLALCQY